MLWIHYIAFLIELDVICTEQRSEMFNIRVDKKRRLSFQSNFSHPSKFHFLSRCTLRHGLNYPSGFAGPVINSLMADTNHVWLVSSRICCLNLPVPCFCLDLRDPTGWPLTPRHMISVCDLWPVWIIKEAWPRGDCIGNLSMMISDLVWGKGGGRMKASPIFRNDDTAQCVSVCVCVLAVTYTL